MRELEEQLQRIEDKVDLLLAALLEQADESEEVAFALDGTPAGQERAKGLDLG